MHNQIGPLEIRMQKIEIGLPRHSIFCGIAISMLLPLMAVSASAQGHADPQPVAVSISITAPEGGYIVNDRAYNAVSVPQGTKADLTLKAQLDGKAAEARIAGSYSGTVDKATVFSTPDGNTFVTLPGGNVFPVVPRAAAAGSSASSPATEASRVYAAWCLVMTSQIKEFTSPKILLSSQRGTSGS